MQIDFRNYNVSNSVKQQSYHIIKIYKQGTNQPLFTSNPIQTYGELKNIFSGFFNCDIIDLPPTPSPPPPPPPPPPFNPGDP